MLAPAPLTGSSNTAPKKRGSPSARHVLGLVLSVGLLAEAQAQQPVTVRLASIAGPSEALPAPGLPAMLPAPVASGLTLADLEQIAVSNNPSLGRAQALVTAA